MKGGEAAVKYDMEGIYREHFHVVYLYALGLSGDSGVTEDVVQETFLKAWKHIDSFRGECDIKTWLCRIARNEYYSYCKKNRLVCGIRETDSIPEADSGIRFEQMPEDEEAADKIREILHGMPEPYKEVFSLRVFGELPFEKIGRLFGKSANWACVTYHRAKAMIRKEMEEFI